MVASNTRDCFRACVGKRVIGVLFEALPAGRRNLAIGTKTLIFEDGTGLTIAGNGSFWIENSEDIKRAIEYHKTELEATKA